MGWRLTLRRWRIELCVLLGVVVAVTAFLVAMLRGTDFGPYSHEINDMTLECRAREKSQPEQDCRACCVDRWHPDIKVSVDGRAGLLGCTCYAGE